MDDDAGGGPWDVPIERGEVGAKGSSKIVSVCARRVLIVGNEWSDKVSMCVRIGLEEYVDQGWSGVSIRFFGLRGVC